MESCRPLTPTLSPQAGEGVLRGFVIRKGKPKPPGRLARIHGPQNCQNRTLKYVIFRLPSGWLQMRSLKRIGAGQTGATSGTATDDKILRRFRAALDELYGDRIERVVLFGSRARGDAHEASDYDIAVFLKDLTDRWREFHRLADLRTEILADTGVL
jgi:uncharacterized protein